MQEEKGEALHLPPATGGKPVPVQVGQQATTPMMKPMTHKDVIQMASRSHLSGEQQSSVMADMRSMWGRKVVEPGLKQFSSYYTVEEKPFMATGDHSTPKHLFFCIDLSGLVKKKWLS